MKRVSFLLVIGGFVGLLLNLFPAAARAASCSSVCTSTASCDLACTAIGGGDPELTTCGDWGRCAYPQTCTSNWVTTSTAIGGFAVQTFNPSGCDYYGVSRITKHDTNGCSPDQVSCQITFSAHRSDSLCCSYYWCGGTTSC
jgi:hypothetical protein